MRLVTVSCFSLLATGCSFIFVRPPPSNAEKLGYFDCVSNGAAPATDVTNAVVDGLIVASSLEANETGVAAGAGVVGAMYAASAIYGLVMTSRCGREKERLATRLHELERNRAIQSAELRVERDAQSAPVVPAPSEPRGCRSDLDCKGERICVNATCVYPPPPLAPAAPLPAPIPATPPPGPALAPSSATP